MKKFFFISMACAISSLSLISSFDNDQSNSALIMEPYDLLLDMNSISTIPVAYTDVGMDTVFIPITITIENNGTEPVQNVEIINNLPPGLVFDTAPMGNSIWTPSGTVPNAYVTTIPGPIAPNSSELVTISVLAKPSGNANDWTNSATILSFENTAGMEEANNPIDDTDQFTVRIMDLALKKEFTGPADFTYGDLLTFTITVYNQGNETPSIVGIQEFITEGYDFSVGDNTGWLLSGARPVTQINNLSPGDSAMVDINLTITDDFNDGGAWDNFAEIFFIQDDNSINVSNNEADSRPNNLMDFTQVLPGDSLDNDITRGGAPFNEVEDDFDPAAPRVLDVALIKEKATSQASYSYSQQVDYVLEIHNQGNVPFTNVNIQDYIPCGLEFVPSIFGWNYDPSTRLLTKEITDTIQPSTIHIDTLRVLVNPCYVQADSAWINFAEVTSLTPTDGGPMNDIDSEFDMNLFNDLGGEAEGPSDNALNGHMDFDEDDHDVELIQVYDLAIKKELITPEPYTYGDDLDFRIRLINQGGVSAINIDVIDYIPPGLSYDQAVNGPNGWATTPNGIINRVSNELVSGDSIDLIITLTVEEGVNRDDWFNRAHIFNTQDLVGNNRFDDADSYPGDLNIAELAEEPGDANDNDVRIVNLPNQDLLEDDSDPAGFEVWDLSLEKVLTSDTTGLAIGDELTFDIIIRNEGGSAVDEVTIVDYLPCGYTLNSNPVNSIWSPVPMTDYVSTTVNQRIRNGDSIIVSIAVVAVECMTPMIGDHTNMAEIQSFQDSLGNVADDFDSTPDADPTNDLAGEDDIDEVVIVIMNTDSFDLELSKNYIPSGADVKYGDPVDFEITVRNTGTLDATAISITDYVPCGFSFDPALNAGWSLATGSNIQFDYNTVLPVGDSVVVDLVLNLEPCDDIATAWVNSAEISATTDENGNMNTDFDSSADTNPDNDLDGEDDIDSTTVPVFDLTLEKTSTLTGDIEIGSQVEYTITVSNQGNQIASNFEVSDYLPCGLLFSMADNPTWIEANGIVSTTYNAALDPGVSADFTLLLEVQTCTAALDLINQAEISSSDPDADSDPDDDPDNDPPGEDDISSDTLDYYDLSLSKSVLTDGQTYGETIQFGLTVTNEGTLPINGFTLTEYLPCGLVFVASNLGWTLNPMNGYYEYISSDLLAPGMSQTVTLDVVLAPCLSPDAYLNVAEISEILDDTDMSVEDFDSDPDDNPNNDPDGEDDIDEVEIDIFDLSLSKAILSNASAYGEQVEFQISVLNEGNQVAQNVEIVDYLRCGYTFDAAENPGWTEVSGILRYTWPNDILPGNSEGVDLVLTLEPCIGEPADYTNGAEIAVSDEDADSTPDDNPDNDLDDEDDTDEVNNPIIDLSLTKTVSAPQPSYEVGDVLSYNFEVANEGSEDVSGFTITEYLPCGLALTGNNPDWSPVAGTSFVATSSNVALLAGSSANVTIELEVVDCPDTDAFVNVAEISEILDENGDPVDDFDSDPDADPDNDPPGEDDIDSVGINVIMGSTLGGDLWKDLNGNGINEVGEPPVQGVTVNLLVCGSPDVIATTMSDANGAYSFPGLSAGQFTISFDLSTVPGGCVTTLSNQGGDDEIDSDINQLGNISCVDVVNGQDDLTNDGGFVETTTIGDFVWNDLNGDGAQGFSEPGIPDVSVSLFTSGNGIIATTTTDVNGNYEFEGVTPGDYYVVFTAPSEFEVTVPNNTNDNNDSDITGANGEGSTDVFTVLSGVPNDNIDAGFFTCTTICGAIWYDSNFNDKEDSNENGINGLDVILFKLVNGIYVEIDDTKTGHQPGTPSDDGYYEFCEGPGTYYIQVVIPPLGLVQVVPFVGNSNQDSHLTNAFGGGTSDAFVVTGGQGSCDIDGGYYPMATVGNLVWFDENNDGVQNGNEPRMEGVMVEAFDIYGDKVGEDVTDNNGSYEINYLRKQDYFLKFTPPDGLGFTLPNATSDDADSDVDHTLGANTTNLFALQPNTNYITIDAGVTSSVLPVSWTSITVSDEGRYHALNWTVAQEKNNEKFVIERRLADELKFVSIGEVSSLGDTNEERSYVFNDEDVHYDGRYIYRVKQQDYDGRSTYSDIVEVVKDRTGKFNLDVYPNPASLGANLSVFGTEGEYTVDLRKADGALVASWKSDEPSIFINLDTYAKGIYYIHVKNKGNSMTKKLFIVE